MSEAPFKGTRSKINYQNLLINDIQYRKAPVRNELRRESRVFSPLPNNLITSTSEISPIAIEEADDEEEGENTMEFQQQQQFVNDNKEQFEEFTRTLQAAKQIEQQLLAKTPEFGSTVDSVSQWLHFNEFMFDKLSYPRMCWVDEASKHLPSDLIDSWYATVQPTIDNNWDIFKQRIIQHVKGPSDSSLQPQTHRPTTITTSQDSSIKDDDDLNARGFEDFIRKNFIRFLGHNQEVEEWLAATIVQFEDFKILQSKWMDYIPSLLSGKARVWFGVNRRKFFDFDGFVEKFVVEFTAKPHSSSSSSNQDVVVATTTTDPAGVSRKDPVELNLIKSLNEQVIRKLKMFGGKHDNVVSWIDELEAHFNAHGWSENVKMKCVPTVLQDLALKWYNRNSLTIKSWTDFASKIKEEFGSKFRQQEAFERLRNYKQTINQSVTEYYNGLLDVCREIDPTPTNDHILQNLLSNVRPSLKIKVLEKQPQTPNEFLHYAKTFEHLEKLVKDEVALSSTIERMEQPYIA
ncbi:unnamed protein product, partial [Didymodactylos carnosus]